MTSLCLASLEAQREFLRQNVSAAVLAEAAEKFPAQVCPTPVAVAGPLLEISLRNVNCLASASESRSSQSPPTVHVQPPTNASTTPAGYPLWVKESTVAPSSTSAVSSESTLGQLSTPDSGENRPRSSTLHLEVKGRAPRTRLPMAVPSWPVSDGLSRPYAALPPFGGANLSGPLQLPEEWREFWETYFPEADAEADLLTRPQTPSHTEYQTAPFSDLLEGASKVAEVMKGLEPALEGSRGGSLKQRERAVEIAGGPEDMAQPLPSRRWGRPPNLSKGEDVRQMLKGTQAWGKLLSHPMASECDHVSQIPHTQESRQNDWSHLFCIRRKYCFDRLGPDTSLQPRFRRARIARRSWPERYNYKPNVPTERQSSRAMT